MTWMQGARDGAVGWALALLLIGAGLLAGCGSGEDVAAVAKQKGLLKTPTNTIADMTGTTPMSVAWDGMFYYTVSGGVTTGNSFARYLPDGTFDISAAPGLDLRALITNNGGSLFANEYGGYGGTLFSFTSSGGTTPLVDLVNADLQAKAAFNGDDSEVYLRSGSVVYRYSAASGTLLSPLTLTGMTSGELSVANTLATSPDGRLYTYENGNVSEWSLTGVRLRSFAVPIATPVSSETIYSFSIANGMVWLYDATALPGVWRGFGGL